MNCGTRKFFFVVAGLFLLFLSRTFAQSAPTIQWQRSLGGTAGDGATSIQLTRDGGFIVAGTTSSTNGDVTRYHGGMDFWVIKLDIAGVIQWSNCYGGTADDFATSIQQTTDGGYIVAGTTYSNDYDVHGNHGRQDFWIVKLDSAGNIQWSQALGGSEQDEAQCVRQTTDGGYIIAGLTTSIDGQVIGKFDHSYDCWIVKLGSTGTIEWESTLGVDVPKSAFGIQQSIDGGYIVIGNSDSVAGIAAGHHGHNDLWIVKLDNSGNVKWQKFLGGNQDEVGYSIAQSSDAGFIATGSASSNDGDIIGNQGASAAWCVKLDVSGHIEWTRALGGSEGEVAYCVRQTSDSGYIVAASSNSSDGDVTGHHANTSSVVYNDYWLVKLDNTGAIKWQKSLGGSADDTPSSVVETADGGYVVVGTSNSTDGDVIGNHGDYDAWIVKLAFKVPAITSLSNIHLPVLCCDGMQLDTVWIHNIGTGTLVVDSAIFQSGAQLFSLLPLSFPDSIAPGDSAIFIVRFVSSAVGTFATALNIYSNDTSTARHPWPIMFTGRKDSVDIGVSAVRGDTLDFGYLSCGVSRDSAIALENNSTVATTVTAQSNNASLFTVSPSVYLNVDTQQSLPVHFNGEGLPGTYTSTLTITDTCGRIHTLTLIARVDSAIFTVLSSPDTMICPSDSVMRVSSIRNLSRAEQTVQLSTTNPLCSVTPSSIAIAPGVSTSVEVVFHGTVTSGVYPVTYTMTDACGGVQTTTMTVHVAAPAITVPASFTVTVCPFTPVKVVLPITNVDSVTRSLAYTSAMCTLAHANSTLRRGEMDSLLVTYLGGAAGTYPCMIHVVDECGIAHDVTMTVNVQIPPALALSPSTDPLPTAIGKIEKKIYIIATPASAISGSDITFTATNEPTALQFDSATSTCGIRVVSGINAATITIFGCPTPASDTLATLFYRPLVGSTLAPWVRVLNVSTTNACQSITGSGTAAISLLPPGCELGTVLVHPFTTVLQSVYPNPATGATTINYSTIENANLTIEVFDALGRRTNTLVNAEHQPGKYSVMLDASALTTGVYCIMLREGKYLDKRELIVGR